MSSELYHITVDGDRREWDGVDSLPRHDVIHVVAGELKHGADKIVIERAGQEEELNV